MAVVNRIGWVDSRAVVTADLSAALSFSSNRTTVPARTTNGYIFISVPSSTGGIASLLIGVNHSNQVHFYPMLAAAVDDADGDANIVHVSLGEQTFLLSGQTISFSTVNAASTDTGLVTVADLRAALKYGTSTEETTTLTRLLNVSVEVVNKYVEGSTVPDAVKVESIVRTAGYLSDSPFASAGDNFAAALHNSGARSLLSQFKTHRAGAVNAA